MKTKRPIHLTFVEEEPMLGRLGHNNRTSTIFTQDAPPTWVELGEEKNSDGKQTGIIRRKLIQSFDVGENETRRISEMSQLDRMVYQSMAVYNGTAWRYEQNRNHGMFGTDLYRTIDPKDTYLTRNDDGDLVLRPVVSGIRMYDPCGKCDTCKRKWSGMCEKVGGIGYLPREVIPRRELEHRPLSIYKLDDAIGIANQAMVEAGLIDEFGEPIETDDGNRKDAIEFIEKNVPGEFDSTLESREEWEARVQAWIREQEKALAFLETSEDRNHEHPPKWALEGYGSAQVGEDGEVEDWEPQGETEQEFTQQLLGSLHENSDRNSTPRDHSIPMGKTDQQFYDHFPQGHPLAWLINLVLNFARNQKEEYTSYWKQVSKGKRVKQKEEMVDIGIEVHQDYLMDWELVATELQAKLALVTESIKTAGGRAMKALWAEKAAIEGDIKNTQNWVKYLEKRRCFEDVGETVVSTDSFSFKESDLIPWRSQAEYCRWRLDTGKTLGWDYKKLDKDLNPSRNLMPIAQAWPDLWYELHQFITEAEEADNVALGTDVMRNGQYLHPLDDAAIAALDRIDAEYGKQCKHDFMLSVMEFNAQPLLVKFEQLREQLMEHTVTKFEDEIPEHDWLWEGSLKKPFDWLLKHKGPEVRAFLNDGYRRIKDFDGKDRVVSRLGMVGRIMGKAQRATSSVTKADGTAKDVRAQKKALFWLVRKEWIDRLATLKQQLQTGFTLPDGLDLQHATVDEMLASEHFKALGPITASAVAIAIRRRRLSGHRRWDRWRERNINERGIWRIDDLLDLQVNLEFPFLVDSDEDGEPIQHPNPKKPGVTKTIGFYEGSKEARAWEGRLEVEPSVMSHRVNKTLFQVDNVTNRGQMRSTLLLRFTSQNPGQVATLVRAIRAAGKRAKLLNQPGLLDALGRQLHDHKGLSKLDYEAIWATYDATKKKLQAKAL